MGRNYTTDEVRRKLDDPGDRFFLVDVMTPKSYADQHLPGAINLPLEDLEAKAAALLPDRGAEIIAYCGSEH